MARTCSYKSPLTPPAFIPLDRSVAAGADDTGNGDSRDRITETRERCTRTWYTALPFEAGERGSIGMDGSLGRDRVLRVV